MEIVSGPPSHLNRLMAQGKLDISAVSSIEYARHQERYVLVPDLSISCHGPVKSVMLCSRTPLEDLHRGCICATRQSHTSVALLRIVLERFMGVEAELAGADIQNLLREGKKPQAFLAIGNEALLLRGHCDYPYKWDMGEVWHRWTGLPFVFGLWVIQRSAVEARGEDLERAVRWLSAAKRWGRRHHRQICKVAAQSEILTQGQAEAYYQGLNFNLNEGERSGLRRFFEMLLEMGEIEAMPVLESHPPLASVA
jgi:chorismate dehydratase